MPASSPATTAPAFAPGAPAIAGHQPGRDFSLSSGKGVYREDAFTARGRRNPVISFDKINEIQKTKMLAGEEGTAQYIRVGTGASSGRWRNS